MTWADQRYGVAVTGNEVLTVMRPPPAARALARSNRNRDRGAATRVWLANRRLRSGNRSSFGPYIHDGATPDSSAPRQWPCRHHLCERSRTLKGRSVSAQTQLDPEFPVRPRIGSDPLVRAAPASDVHQASLFLDFRSHGSNRSIQSYR